ncbi:hypothetical protein [Amycolatopsis orientalis]|uniref:hypothetical protein n=1 Tax=Amycolatopsis orientalis TaxID=31958 RepID=UPI0003A04141|nr:hypothetical protein [Amycolatopsis orientalis]
MGEPSSTKTATAALVLSVLSWLAFLGSYSARSRTLGDAVYYEPFTVLGPPVLSLLAIVFGHLGLRRTGIGGRGRAATALVLGYLALALEAARIVALAAAG